MSLSEVVSVSRVQSPGPPFGSDAFFKPGAGRLALVRAGTTEGASEGRLLGRRDDELATLGHVQAQKAAELLMDIKVRLLALSQLQT